MGSKQNIENLSFRARVPVFDANIGVGHCHDRPSPFTDVAELAVGDAAPRRGARLDLPPPRRNPQRD